MKKLLFMDNDRMLVKNENQNNVQRYRCVNVKKLATVMQDLTFHQL